MNASRDRVDLHRAKFRGFGWKFTSLLLIYLLLAAFFNIAWRFLFHLPPQMQHGILDPGLMLLTGIILLGRSWRHRPGPYIFSITGHWAP
jgi:hypothetical protein